MRRGSGRRRRLSSINIKRAVENIRSGTTVYTPVIELIVNAIQAIRVSKPTGGLIRVTILRAGQVDMIDRIAPVDGFVVEDDGIGFDQALQAAHLPLHPRQSGAQGLAARLCGHRVHAGLHGVEGGRAKRSGRIVRQSCLPDHRPIGVPCSGEDAGKPLLII